MREAGYKLFLSGLPRMLPQRVVGSLHPLRPELLELRWARSSLACQGSGLATQGECVAFPSSILLAQGPQD